MSRSEASELKNPGALPVVSVRGRSLLLAAAAATLCTIAAALAPSALAAGSVHADPKGDTRGPLDLTGVRFEQTGLEVVLTFRTAAAVPSEELPGSGRGTLCATFSWGTPVQPRRRLCLVGVGEKVFVNDDTLAPTTERILRRVVRKTIGTRTGSRFVVRVAPATIGLPVGLVHLAVRSTWHEGAVCRAPAAGCVDQLPDAGTLPVRVRRAVAAGCQPSSGQVTNGPRTKKVVALTFDDGPSVYTPGFLRILRAENVPATFFQIGQQVPGQGAIERAILAQGSAIGDHTWTHANVAGGGPAAYSQLSRTKSAITAATGGYVPCVFRPPYGASSRALVSVGGSLGMTSVLWDVDTNDWQLPGTAAIVSRVVNGVRPGSITLMHDGGGNRSQGQAALRPIIQQLKAKGYGFVTVPELLGLQTRYRLSDR